MLAVKKASYQEQLVSLLVEDIEKYLKYLSTDHFKARSKI
jgi:hypothetical protein